MKTIKLLCIAIWGIIVGNAESLPPAKPAAGTNVLDFNTITNDGDNIPAMFQPKIYKPAGYNVAGPNNLRYVYFTVINNVPNAVPTQVNFQTAQSSTPNPNNEHNIYFPADGSQPTTTEAVKYSCANIGVYDINHPITEWYLRMFGWIPEDDTKGGADYDQPGRLKVGFDNNIETMPLLLMPSALVKNDNIFLNNRLSLTKRQAFWHFFRYIASSPVGRVLLYRLLIEVRRVKNGTGSVCNGITVNQIYITQRNQNRYLTLEWRNCNCFNKDNNRLGFCCTNVAALQSITEDIKKDNVLILPYCSWYASYADISIFHELCHWFHFLRNPNRYIEEKTAGNNTILINGKMYDETLKIPLAQYIYGEVYANDKNKSRWRVSALPWRDGNHVHFEELRNIIGAPNTVDSYLEGDDLSENLYRLSLGHPLRFGHTCEIYLESKTIVDTIKNIATCNACPFELTILNLTVPSIFSTLVIVPSLELDGLNNCKYPRNDLLYKSSSIFPMEK